MFNYPLPKPKNTFYHKIGVTPEATDSEIGAAMDEMRNVLKSKQSKLTNQLSKIKEKIPDLDMINSRISQLEKQHDHIDHDELKKAIDKRDALEAEAEKIDPDYKKYVAEKEKVDKKLNEINQMGLEDSEKRQEYDQMTPPCALLGLSECTYPVFSDTRVAMYLLRKELTEFFENEKQRTCYHPSDFTKKYFVSDFYYNEHLDGG